MQLKIFLIWSSGRYFVQRSGTICVILVEGIMRKFCEIILNLIEPVDQEMSFKRLLI